MRVLVVCAHPREDSFTRAATAAAVRGCERAGHDVTMLDLYGLDFRAAMSLEERRAYSSEQPLIDPVTVEHAGLVMSADMLVFVYPTWWSGQPAILKGWLERVLVNNVAFRMERDRVRPNLGHVKRLVGITSHGSPWTFVKVLQDGGRRTITRALRMNCGWRTRSTWLAIYSMDTADEAERAAFLDRVEHTMAHTR